MVKRPGTSIAKTLVVIAAVAALIGVVYASFPRAGEPSATASATPTELAASPTATIAPATPSAEPSPSADPTPTETVAPTPTATATERTGPPSPNHGAPVATFRNPNGPPRSDFPPDGYPMFEIVQALPTYAILWLDENQRDVHVALTGDIDGAIDAIRDGVPNDVTVYFYIAERSQEELCAIRDAIFEDREELMLAGILVTSGGCGNAAGTVTIGLTPLTPEALAYMSSRYEGPIEYEPGGYRALDQYRLPEPAMVELTAVRSEAEFGLLTCGRQPFPTRAIDAAPTDIDGAGPELAALRESLERGEAIYGDLTGLGWILAVSDAYRATFIADRGDTWLEVGVFPAGSKWVPGVIDYCSPRPLILADGGPVEIYLDPAYPKPRASTTELHVLVHETACTGSRSPAGWMLPPVAIYSETTLTLAIHTRTDAGFATCPGNPTLPVTVILPEPLGDRELRGIIKRPDY